MAEHTTKNSSVSTKAVKKHTNMVANNPQFIYILMFGWVFSYVSKIKSGDSNAGDIYDIYLPIKSP